VWGAAVLMALGQVGNYRLETLLGVGGMGDVYRAYDTHRDRYVALKLLPEALSGDQEYLARFRRESNVAARLRDPHVIPIHDFGEIDGRLFIDMRLVDGSDIGALLKRYGRIEPQRAAYLISQVAEALDAAHADHLVHRDIKPSNILVTPSDFVYVVDFGIARSFGGRQTPLTHTGAYIGTLDYMAPERFIGHDIDGRADVYSLACLLHECLTGAPPFSGRDLPALMYAQLYFDPPEASSLVEGIPPALDAVIARGMAKDPKVRFATAGALAAAAREASLDEAPASQMTDPQPHTPAATAAAARQAAPPEAPASQTVDLQPHTSTGTPDPMRQAAAAAAAWPGVAEPPAPDPELAGDPATQDLPDGPTLTVTADGVEDRGDARPPENRPEGTSLNPDGSGPPSGGAPAGPARRPAWRRLGVPILAAVAALAVAIVLVVRAFPGTKAGDTSPTQNPGSVPSLAPPTVAGTIQVGQNPSFVQVAPNGKFAYITDVGAQAITVLDTVTDKVSKTISIPGGPPQFVSFSNDGKTAYVSVYDTRGSVHLIVFIDTATGQVTGQVPVTNHTPGPSQVSPNDRYLYVPNHNSMTMSGAMKAMSGPGQDDIDVINTATKKLADTIPLAPNPHWIAVGQDGLLYVTNHTSGEITIVNSNTNKVVKVFPVGETPHAIYTSPDRSLLAVTSYGGAEVFIVSTATDKVVATIPVGREPLDVEYTPDGRYICTTNSEDNTVSVIDAATNKVIDTIKTGKQPTSIDFLPNGRQGYVTDEGSGTVEILNFPIDAPSSGSPGTSY
jgi:YVTN family beta-propeller protein